jgi:hydroxymethylbilane synthase
VSALRIATRTSPLARWQADTVASGLKETAGLHCSIVGVSTGGDRDQSASLSELGGKGVFVTEVQAAVLSGAADLAVHSAKDMPAVPTPGLEIAAFLKRADPRDAVVGEPLGSLPDGAIVATGSPRRRSIVADRYPRLRIVELRGNIATRLSKVGQPAAKDSNTQDPSAQDPSAQDPSESIRSIIVAAAALDRLGLSARAAEVLDPAWFIPQVGQGIIAVECRADDTALIEALAALDHGPTRSEALAERAFLAELGGDCRLPAAAHARATEDGLSLDSMLALPSGRRGADGVADAVLKVDRSSGPDPEVLGRSAARRLLGSSR